MSKYVKNLLTNEVKNRLEGVQDAIIVDVIGMNSAATYRVRKHLRDKGIHMLAVKRSIANRAASESTLRPLFDHKQGSVAVVWGCEDFVSLAKCIAEVDKKQSEFPKFTLKGGVMDGDGLTAEQVLAVSKWPNRQEQISILVGQILAPGAKLSSQLLGPGAKLASQVSQLVEDKEGQG